jgi:hypothetical protein
LLYSTVADYLLNTSFAQRITVLTPHISEHERQEFAALWASMRNRRDYERLNAKLEDTATARGVKLPKPLLP